MIAGSPPISCPDELYVTATPPPSGYMEPGRRAHDTVQTLLGSQVSYFSLTCFVVTRALAKASVYHAKAGSVADKVSPLEHYAACVSVRINSSWRCVWFWHVSVAGLNWCPSARKPRGQTSCGHPDEYSTATQSHSEAVRLVWKASAFIVKDRFHLELPQCSLQSTRWRYSLLNSQPLLARVHLNQEHFFHFFSFFSRLKPLWCKAYHKMILWRISSL